MSIEDQMAAALQTFLTEANELLQEIEGGLLALERGDDSDEAVNHVFRGIHTIKGSSGLFGLEPVVRFTHVVESVLDRVRDGDVPVTADLVGLLLPCRDHIANLLVAAAEGGPDDEAERGGADLLARLQPYLDGPGPAVQAATTEPPAPQTAGRQAASEQAATPPPAAPLPADASHGDLHLSLRFSADCLRNGLDPLSFVRYLATLGEIVTMATLTETVPPASEMDPEDCHVAFELTFRTEADLPTIEGVFDFVADEGDIRILPPGTPAEAFADLVASYGERGSTVAEVLVRSGSVSAGALRAAIAAAGGTSPVSADGPSAAAERPVPVDAATAAEPTDADDAAVGSEPDTATDDPAPQAAAFTGEPAPAVPSPRAAPAATSMSGGADNRTIRVDAARLDRLIDSVGELVIAGAGAGLRAQLSGDESLEVALGEVMRLVEEVRDSALQLRMVPIGTTFGRFQRVVRDVSAALGKDVSLIISGGDTEVDKALVEQIGDPLTHLVRNALDHGIEPAEVRAASGKPVRGTLRLNAFHDSGSIVIEVQDDGGGIDVDRVLAKAVSKGLVAPDATPSDKDVYALIFEPGFSTAASVSDLSGRGVGMDVVKRNVTALRGTIDVDSRRGEGTTMRIRLPLTLAIIDGFLVEVGGATYVIPLDRVVECVDLPKDAEQRRDCMDLRGEVLPFIRLRSHFSIPGERPRRENVVVVEYAGTKTGLVVDHLKGEFQTVIKPLGQLFTHVQGIGGSTILGNGDVALIIDVPMLVRHVEQMQSAAPHA